MSSLNILFDGADGTYMNKIISTIITKIDTRQLSHEARHELSYLISAILAAISACVVSIPLQYYVGNQQFTRVLGFAVLCSIAGGVLLVRGYYLACKVLLHFGAGASIFYIYLFSEHSLSAEIAFPVLLVLTLFFYQHEKRYISLTARIASAGLMISALLLRGVLVEREVSLFTAMTAQRLILGVAVLAIIYVPISRFIDELRSTNQKLRQATAEFNVIGRAIDDCFFIFDVQADSYSFMSYAYADVFGRSPLAGQEGWQDFLSCVERNDLERVRRAFREAAGQLRTELTYQYVAGPGDLRTIRSVLNYLGPPDHPTAVVIGVHRNITDEIRAKKAEEEKRIQSIQASRLSLLGEMAGGVAHEINNPLAIIDGNVDLLRQKLGSEDPSIQRGLDKINLMVVRIAKIVRGLLVFSGQTDESHRELYSIQKIIEDALDFYAEKAAGAGIKMAVCVPPMPPNVLVNPPQISQVILHLLTNALDAVANLPEKWVRVDVKVDGSDVVVSITDSGAGIPEKIAEKIMQPFFTTKDIGKGTGLGLSVSRGIVVAHGGTLELDRSSKNTCFQVRLPHSAASNQAA